MKFHAGAATEGRPYNLLQEKFGHSKFFYFFLEKPGYWIFSLGILEKRKVGAAAAGRRGGPGPLFCLF
jgi:hypothetical protein